MMCDVRPGTVMMVIDIETVVSMKMMVVLPLLQHITVS